MKTAMSNPTTILSVDGYDLQNVDARYPGRHVNIAQQDIFQENFTEPTGKSIGD